MMIPHHSYNYHYPFMNRRYFFYCAFAVAFVLFDWYAPFWSRLLPPLPPTWVWFNYALWLVPAIGVSLYEAEASRSILHSAVVTALFWFVAIIVCYTYYVIAVFAPEEYFTFADVVEFSSGAIVPKGMKWGTVALVGGALVGASLSWCYLLARRALGRVGDKRTAEAGN